MKADVVFIAALTKELDALIGENGSGHGLEWEQVHSNLTIRTYYMARVGALRVAAVQAGSMGQLHAAIVTADVMTDLEPAVIVLVGIAATVVDNIDLGDIVIAQNIIDTQPGKITEEGTCGNFPPQALDEHLLARIESFKDKSWSAKIPASRPEGAGTPNRHKGDFLCSNQVVASVEQVQLFTRIFRKAIALEMESMGVATAIHQHQTNRPKFAVIKGVVDRADGKKNDLWHEYAAAAAATFAVEWVRSTLTDSDIFKSPQHPDLIDLEVPKLIEKLTFNSLPALPFQRELAHNIVSRALEEAQGALSAQYEANVSMGEQYLLRAAPLFGNASELYATSLDTVSTFWTDPNNRDAANVYLDHQAPNGTAMRLFVFSSPDSAHHHAKVLDRHCDKYRYVFVCSVDHYRDKIEPLILTDSYKSKLRNRDFAILNYCDGAGPGKMILAELDPRSLRFRPLATNPAAREISLEDMRSLYSDWQTLVPGQLCPSSSVLRWSPRFWVNNQNEWSDALTKLFDARKPDATHMVFFKVQTPNVETDFRAWLARVKRDIMVSNPGRQSMADKYKLKHIWIGHKLNGRPVHDGIFGGQVQTTADSVESYALIMRFDTEADLMQFYQDEGHSKIRQTLFESMEPRLKPLYQAAASSQTTRQIAYEAIEAIAGKHIHRRDYVDDESILEMVQTVNPYDP